jgi:hypothetical protein
MIIQGLTNVVKAALALHTNNFICNKQALKSMIAYMFIMTKY